MEQAVLNSYVRFLELDERQIAASRAAWAVIEPRMPELIDRFYDHLFSSDFTHVFFGKDVSAIKRAQIRYWRGLFSGAFDSNYNQHVSKVGEKHQAAGVTLSHYIGSYAWFSEKFFRIIAECTPPEGFTRNQLLVATNKIIYLDMMIAHDRFSVVVLDA